MEFENNIKIGYGIYTIPDISLILRLPNYKVNRWINQYWDKRFAGKFNQKYSWNIKRTKGVSFHTLVEFYTFIQLNEAGVSTKYILRAHECLSNEFNTAFPFAKNNITNSIRTDGEKIYFELNNKDIITLDGTNQFNFEYIKLFFKKLDYGDDNLANKLWPLGKDRSILCDPQRKFGQPIINNKNILAETINDLHLAGNSLALISSLYNLNYSQINDAIEYCERIN